MIVTIALYAHMLDQQIPLDSSLPQSEQDYLTQTAAQIALPESYNDGDTTQPINFTEYTVVDADGTIHNSMPSSPDASRYLQTSTTNPGLLQMPDGSDGAPSSSNFSPIDQAPTEGGAREPKKLSLSIEKEEPMVIAESEAPQIVPDPPLIPIVWPGTGPYHRCGLGMPEQSSGFTGMEVAGRFPTSNDMHSLLGLYDVSYVYVTPWAHKRRYNADGTTYWGWQSFGDIGFIASRVYPKPFNIYMKFPGIAGTIVGAMINNEAAFRVRVQQPKIVQVARWQEYGVWKYRYEIWFTETFYSNESYGENQGWKARQYTVKLPDTACGPQATTIAWLNKAITWAKVTSIAQPYNEGLHGSFITNVNWYDSYFYYDATFNNFNRKTWAQQASSYTTPFKSNYPNGAIPTFGNKIGVSKTVTTSPTDWYAEKVSIDTRP